MIPLAFLSTKKHLKVTVCQQKLIKNLSIFYNTLCCFRIVYYDRIHVLSVYVQIDSSRKGFINFSGVLR